MNYYNSETLLEQQQEIEKLKEQSAALAAQVEALKYAAEKMMFKGRIVSNVCYNIGQRHEDAEQILQAVREYDAEVRKFHDASSIGPQQHLAEIRAQAGRAGFIAGYSKGWNDFDGVDGFRREPLANQYAESVRQEKK